MVVVSTISGLCDGVGTARRFLLVSLAVVVLGGLSARAADVVWVEAERFQEYGGWNNDAQFIDQMGSPYLLATGMGEPVKDAVTRVEIPREGRYRLWVRSRDWALDHHPGRFKVLLNGKPSGRDFGASGKTGWCWEAGGT